MEHDRLDQNEVPRDPELTEAFEAFIQQTQVPLDFHVRVMARVQQRQARGGLLGWWKKMWAWRMPLLVCGATVGVLLFLAFTVWKPALKSPSLVPGQGVPQGQEVTSLNNKPMLEEGKYQVQVTAGEADIPNPIVNFGLGMEFQPNCDDKKRVCNPSKDGCESSATITWSPKSCGEPRIIISISCDRACVERAALFGISVSEGPIPFTILYKGQSGFLNFIREFNTGQSRTFGVNDFVNSALPENQLKVQNTLNKLRISNITVRFHAQASSSLDKLLSLPSSIGVAASPSPLPAPTPSMGSLGATPPAPTAPPATAALPPSAPAPAVTPSGPVETGTAPPMSRRTALVIGNGAYPAGPLQNAVKDATDITAMLRRLSFEVTLLRNASLQEMEEAVHAFNLRLRQGGMGLFYFAGHGVQVEGENYLIPINARLARQQDVRYQALPLRRVMGVMEEAGNGLNILILDACRNMPFSRSWRSNQVGLAPPPTTARGMLIAYATAPGSTAADGAAGENGIYTKHLLQAMAIPGLSIQQVFKQVRYGVVAETRGKQTPWESSSLLEDVAFVPAQADLVSAGVPPYPSAASDPEMVLWSMSERSSHPEDALAFLQAYPESRFAPAARLRLQQLQQQSATASNVPSAPLPGPATPPRAAVSPPSPSPSAPPQPSIERAVPSNVPTGNTSHVEDPLDRPSPPPSSEGYTLIRRIYCEDTESGVLKGSKDLIYTSYISCEEAKSTLLVLEQQKGNCNFLGNARESKQKANAWIGTPSCKIPS
jgi:Caspase domain